MRKSLIVLTHIMVNSTLSEIGGTHQDSTLDSSLSYTVLSTITKSKLASKTTISKPLLSDVWFSNGQYQPTYAMKPTEWFIFDILVASADRYVDLSIVSQPLSGKNGDNIKPRPQQPAENNGCTMRLISTDGSYLQTTRLIDHLTVPPGGRVTLCMRCVNVGTYYLASSASLNDNDENWSVGDFETKSVQPLVILQVVGKKGPRRTSNGLHL